MSSDLPNSISGIRERLGNPNTVGLKFVLDHIETVLIKEEPDPLHFNRPAYALFCRLHELDITGDALVSLYNEYGGDVLAMRSSLGITVWQSVT